MPTKSSAKSPRKTPTKPRKSKVYTISLPPDMARYAESVAKEESRTMSEVFRNAMRSYQSRREQTRKWLDEVAEFVKTLPPTPYTEEDVPRLVKEVRAEMRAERERQARIAE
jgi:Arc/MetJ-type ribon-helix-helix transcriptional regulator